MYDENELLEAIFEGVKRWAFNNNVRNDEIELTRVWATTDSSNAELLLEIGDQKFQIQVAEIIGND
jgi:hypothetical protein